MATSVQLYVPPVSYSYIDNRLNYGLEERKAGVVASYSKQILAIPI